LTESFSTTHGPHTIKAGGEIRHIRFAGTLDYFARGSLTFSGAVTGSGLSDLLAGLPSFGIQASFDNPQNLSTTAYDAWLQDDWKARPTLTISLGMPVLWCAAQWMLGGVSVPLPGARLADSRQGKLTPLFRPECRMCNFRLADDPGRNTESKLQRPRGPKNLWSASFLRDGRSFQSQSNQPVPSWLPI